MYKNDYPYRTPHTAQRTPYTGGSATQQAIVQTFLKNYDKAIGALETAVRSCQTVQLYSLLGRIKMKAAMWEAAVESFNTALEILVRIWANAHKCRPKCKVVNYNYLDVGTHQDK